jgi:hypothetical protein
MRLILEEKKSLEIKEKKEENHFRYIAERDAKIDKLYDKYLHGTTYADRLALIGVLERMVKNLKNDIKFTERTLKGLGADIEALTEMDRYFLNCRRREISRIKKTLADYQ